MASSHSVVPMIEPLADSRLAPSHDPSLSRHGEKSQRLSGLDSEQASIQRGNEIENTTSLPVVYYYLTFETPLPTPSLAGRLNDTAVIPPEPDWKRFANPFDWPAERKLVMLMICSIATAVAAFTVGSYTPAGAQMMAEWNVGQTPILVGITTFCVGFAVSPMVLAPFSEINGRYPVFVASGILYFITVICCAVTRSFAGMLVARFFVGCGCSVFSSMVGGVVSDMYHAKDRNTPMAIFSGSALFGTGIGPLIGGFIAQNLHWRIVFWVQVGVVGVLVAAVALFLDETRGSVLLSRKARCLNDWYEKLEEAGCMGFQMASSREKANIQRIRWKVKADEERESIAKMISISVYRPFHLLFSEPVVFFFSLWVSFAWAVLYLTFGSIPLVFQKTHNFNMEQADSVFAAMSIGAILATILSVYQDTFLSRWLSVKPSNPSRIRRSIDITSPEGRLYFACIESILLPVGLFWFGWSQFSSIPWIVPAMSVTCATMGIYSVYLATFNYLADAYHRYSSSALAAQSFCRNMLGGIFPLVTTPMFNNLTFQGAASLLGGLGALLTIVPWVLVFYGPKIRARSKFAGEIL